MPLLILIILSTSVNAFSIQHEPAGRVSVGTDIPIDARIEVGVNFTIVKVEVVPSYDYDWNAFVLVQLTGDNRSGLFRGSIPATDSIGTMYYTIQVTQNDGSVNHVRLEEYSVDVYTEETGSWLTLPDNPWVTVIGGGALIIVLVILEILVKNRFFGRKKNDDLEKPVRKARKVKK